MTTSASELQEVGPPFEPNRAPGGIIHTYLGYDPQRFPMPAREPPDLVSPAFEHMLAYGNMRRFTDEELANAIELDPSQIRGLGPSLDSLLAMLEERKRKILETYETTGAKQAAHRAYESAAQDAHPPKAKQAAYDRAVRAAQMRDLEKLWYGESQRSEFARSLVTLMDRLGDTFQVEQLAAKYAFTGRTPMSVARAIEIKEELETIDRLIEQLKDAARNAKLYLINMDELARFANEEQIGELEALRRQVEEMVRHLAEEQGLQRDGKQFALTPKAFRVFQSKLLDRIFADLQAARSGRHVDDISGEGAVELPRTKPYEFGDSLANMDVAGSLVNALVRQSQESAACDVPAGSEAGPSPTSPKRIRLTPADIEIHRTRNTPKCATVVVMDMSGSMRHGGQYINVKRMALALHGLIRSEYPGDFVDFVEVFTVAKRRHVSEVPALLPKPVTIYDPIVRLRADLSDERITERDLPPHFTNLQQGLRLARTLLQVQDTPNRQIILITDGLPTAHYEDNQLYMLYPPDRRTEHFTLREGAACRDQGITINVFLLSGWGQTEEDVQFANTLAERTAGRVFFVGGRELERYVVWDYLKQRRYRIG